MLDSPQIGSGIGSDLSQTAASNQVTAIGSNDVFFVDWVQLEPLPSMQKHGVLICFSIKLINLHGLK